MTGSEHAAGIRVLGVTEIGPRRAVALGVEDGRFHTHVIGATGSGKSTLLANLALADMAAGRGVVVIDPKGDLVVDLLARIFTAYWGPRTDDVLRSACATLRRLPGATLADVPVPVLLIDRRFRAPLVAGLSERSGLKGFWDG